MRLLATCMLVFVLLGLAGCGGSAERSDDYRSERGAGVPEQPAATTQTSNTATSTTSKPAASAARTDATKESAIRDGQMKPASLQNAQASVTVTERKLIRNAEMVLESANPSDSSRRVSSIAEAHGGFVVTSDSRQTNADGRLETSVNVTIRVPAAQFDAVINEIRGAGSRVAQDKISTQDVTEEYIDLEARIRAKQALEAQFMEIMKQARTVSDALEVQEQLSDVRAEIERLEGRRRFLENQTSLSTITVSIQPPTQVVSSTGFFYGLKRALGEGTDVAVKITLQLITVFIALLPILLFVALPLVLLLRYLIRRSQRRPVVISAPPPEAPPTVTAT